MNDDIATLGARVSAVEREVAALQDGQSRSDAEARRVGDKILAAIRDLGKLDGVPQQIADLRRELRLELDQRDRVSTEALRALDAKFESNKRHVDDRFDSLEQRLASSAGYARGQVDAVKAGGAMLGWVSEHGIKWVIAIVGGAWGLQQVGVLPQRAPEETQPVARVVREIPADLDTPWQEQLR